jgi:hypothetical protein
MAFKMKGFSGFKSTGSPAKDTKTKADNGSRYQADARHKASIPHDKDNKHVRDISGFKHTETKYGPTSQKHIDKFGADHKSHNLSDKSKTYKDTKDPSEKGLLRPKKSGLPKKQYKSGWDAKAKAQWKTDYRKRNNHKGPIDRKLYPWVNM